MIDTPAISHLSSKRIQIPLIKKNIKLDTFAATLTEFKYFRSIFKNIHY